MKQETTSNTPETDQNLCISHHPNDLLGWPRGRIAEFGGEHIVPADFARRLERERDEWQLCALMKMAVKKLACMWCEEIVHAPTGYEPGTPLSEDQRGQAYREHVAICTAHPIREVERERDEARAMARDMRNQVEKGSTARLLFPWENTAISGGIHHPTNQ